MPAWQTLTIYLTNSSSVTTSLTSSDYNDAVIATQDVVKNGGIWISTTSFIPSSAILQIVIS
jgi:hypothetical protein